jgi:hypothetical protein
VAEHEHQQGITAEQLIEEIKRLKVSDFLLSAVTTLVQLAYAKLEPSTRDTEQARLAIESLKALVPVLKGTIPDHMTSDFNQVVANLQLAYVAALRDEPRAETADRETTDAATEPDAGG